jgi:hypothetical protein
MKNKKTPYEQLPEQLRKWYAPENVHRVYFASETQCHVWFGKDRHQQYRDVYNLEDGLWLMETKPTGV